MFNLGVLLATVVLVGLSVGGVLVANLFVVGLNSKASSLEKQLESRREVINLVSQLEQYKEILDERNSVIETLVDGRVEWGRKLYDLAMLVPEEVWLERLQLETIITRETIQPPAGAAASRRASTRPQYREIRTDYLHIHAVTHNLREKSSIIGEFIDQIYQNESFFADFESVDFQEGEEQPWLERDKDGPRVWRFRLTLKMKSRTPSVASRATSGGSSNNESL